MTSCLLALLCFALKVYKTFHKRELGLRPLALKVYKTFHKHWSLGFYRASVVYLPVVDFQNCVKKNAYNSRSTTGGISCLLPPLNTGAWPRLKDLGPHHLGGRALAHFPFFGKYGGMTLVYVTII